MGRIEKVQDVLMDVIAAAIDGSGITAEGQIYRGYPRPEDLRAQMDAGGWAVCVIPINGGRRLPPRAINHVITKLDPIGLTATPDATGVTFGAVMRAGLNIRVFLMHPLLGRKAFGVATTTNDTLTTVAANLAAQINALPAPVTATSSAARLNISGARGISVNLGTTGTIAREVSRFEQLMQIDIYAPTAYVDSGDPVADINNSLRSVLIDVITSKVGTEADFDYDLADGTSATIRQKSPAMLVDDAQTNYTIFEAHIQYTAEYSILDIEQATQVVEIDTTLHAPNEFDLFMIGG